MRGPPVGLRLTAARVLPGLSFAPTKLQNLAMLNALLAHQPWLITKAHLEALTTGSDSDNWSIAELLQAVMILVTFHSLSGFAWGMAVVPEIDREGGVVGRADESPLFFAGSPADGPRPPEGGARPLTRVDPGPQQRRCSRPTRAYT